MQSNYPNGFTDGVTIRGLPLTMAYPGQVFWVDGSSTTPVRGAVGGQDGGPGTFQRPFATIDYAVGKCVASRGDIIMVKPGHTETVIAAAGLALDVAGIAIIGLGSGSLTPKVTLTTAATADVDVDAADITIHNIHFVSGFADIATAIDVNAQNCTIKNCRFTENATDENFLVCVEGGLTTVSSGLVVEDCYVLQPDAANTHFINVPGTPNGDIYRNNTIIGDFGTMAIGGAGICTYVTIVDNIIYNAAATVDACVNLAATATGLVMRNLGAGGAAQANGFTATACAIAENYYGVLAEDLSAILDPIAT